MNNVVDLPLPARLNNTSDEFTMPAGETPRLHNVIPDAGNLAYPDDAEEFDSDTDASGMNASNEKPVAIMTAGEKILISHKRSASDIDLTYAKDYSEVAWNTLSGWATADFPQGVVYDLSDGSTAQLVQQSSFNETFLPWGYTFPFESGTMGVSAAPVPNRWDSSGSLTNSNTVVGWAGANFDLWSGTCTVNNGSTGVALSGTPSASPVGGFFRMDDSSISGGSSTGERYHFMYRIVAWNGSTGITLSRPYGYGQNTTNVPNVSGGDAHLQPIAWSVGAPPMCACANTWRERVFTGRGAVTNQVGAFYGYYSTLLAWSEPGNPWYFPDENFVILGEDFGDPIMGMLKAGDSLLIFTRTKTFRIAGQDEGDFRVDQLSSRVGIVNSAAGIEFDNTAMWVSPDGYVYMSSGGTPERYSQWGPGRGVRIPSASTAYDATNSTSMTHSGARVIVSPDDDYRNAITDEDEMYVFDVDNGSAYTIAPHHSALFRVNSTGEVGGMYWDGAGWRPRKIAPMVSADGSNDTREATEVWIPISSGVGAPTVKINQFRIHHGSHTSLSPSPTSNEAFDVDYASDEEDDYTVLGTVVGQEETGFLTSVFYNHTWESSTKSQLRGKYFRLRLSRDYTTPRAHNVRVFGIEAHFEPGTKVGRSGNQVT